MKVANLANHISNQTKTAKSKEGVMQIRSILVPVDFSETSNKAVHYATELAQEFGARITLLYVMEPVSLREFTAAYPIEVENDELVALCKTKLLNSAEKCHAQRDLIEATLVRRGPAYREIVDAAREREVDLIIIGTHGNSGLNRLLLGSVTERVVQCAPCPVLVVREKEHDFISG